MAYRAWTMSKGGSLNEYLRRRGLGPKRAGEFMFVLQKRLGHVSSDLDKSAGTRSPGSWAYHLNTCTTALNTFSNTKERFGDVDRTATFLTVSPEGVVRWMRRLTANIVEVTNQYRKAGIDPQVHVTVNPYLDRAKKAAVRWKAANTDAHEPCRPEAQAHGEIPLSQPTSP
jgi:hypothetical protein